MPTGPTVRALFGHEHQVAIHWLCHAGDRRLKGDKVQYLQRIEAGGILEVSCAGASVVAEARVNPWNNTFAMLVQV